MKSKKWLVSLLSLAMTITGGLALSACNNGGNSSSTDSSVEDSSVDVSVDNSSADVSVENSSVAPAPESSEDVSEDNSSMDITAEDSSEDVSVEDSSVAPAPESSEDVSVEDSSEDVSVEDSSEDVSVEDSSEDVSVEDSSEDVSVEDSSSEEEEFSAPVITVNPDYVEINAGDEIDLMLGVEVTDEYDEYLEAWIEDDGGFDGETEGTYTITYGVENSKGVTATATRTIVVSAPKANVLVEVPYEKTGKWSGTVLTFANSLYHALTEDTAYSSAQTGIYHNVSGNPIVVDIVGGYGQASILNEYGELLVGRDGTNNHVVTQANPNRATAPATYEYGGQSYGVQANTARFMEIPAGGMAIVVFQDYAGQGFDNDGRGFVCHNINRQYGMVASVYLADGESAPYTTYRNQAPTIENISPVSVTKGAKTQDEVDTLVKTGLSILDDNGTFGASDDKSATIEIAITDRGGLDVNTVGEYVYTCTLSDGTLTTTFTRTVKVVADVMTVAVEGATAKDFEKSKVCVNQTAGNYANWDLCVYTNKFTGTLTANSYGAAMIIGADGKIKAVYNGTNGEYLDANNVGEGGREGYGVTGKRNGFGDSDTGITISNYLTVAFSELQDGEILLVGANGMPGNTTRGWVLGFRRKTNDPITTWIGTPVTITGITLA